jgi:murein DD-endopeptidase MepM/ murein hydrolase activator NlpD
VTPLRLTPIGVLAIPAAAPLLALPARHPEPEPPPIPARPTRSSTAIPRSKSRRGGWTVMVMPAATGSVRNYHIRPWQLRTVFTALTLLVVGALVGGAGLGLHWQDEELASLDTQLWNTQISAAALGDTLEAMRLAAIVSPSTMATAAPRPGRGSRTVALTRPASGVTLPVIGRISSGYSLSRRHPVLMIRRPHRGVDVVAPAGTRVHAPADGRVARVAREFGYGLYIELDHGGGVRTRYAHLRSALVEPGDRITAGTPIATVGSSGLSSGPHLHYEVWVKGNTVNPLRHRFAASISLNLADSAGPGTPADSVAKPAAK